ncbi:Fms-interacting protein-domain-containing protein [Piptocephalis cylindrospora]|uniref:Fms-interacting protein-domain-containing protein n=1 Tax=Piptocephalis cylindrospora TaxID=1907219 RepID=A0A4P9XYX7_9FUNG|nr:Fms-interacting protein-domain-containing protein [Piptocephalis cylindrospora]|eukprot:RKP11656.1 Fms-interacting protein-domain-containing protein [Piptocephalis cylindrospora]
MIKVIEAVKADTHPAHALLLSLQEIRELGKYISSFDGEDVVDVQALHLQTATLFSLARRHLREVGTHHVEGKRRMDETRVQLDAQRTRWRNLEYERADLLEEIRKNDAFESVEDQVNLASEDHFWSQYKAELDDEGKGGAEDTMNGHQLALCRLEFELKERLSLKKELEGLRQEYSRMAAESRKKQVALDALDTRVLAYFQNASAILAEFGVFLNEDEDTAMKDATDGTPTLISVPTDDPEEHGDEGRRGRREDQEDSG